MRLFIATTDICGCLLAKSTVDYLNMNKLPNYFCDICHKEIIMLIKVKIM